MISDISGKFTYSWNNKQVAFIYNEELFRKEHENLNHFQDRNKIGVITNKVDDIVTIGNEISLIKKMLKINKRFPNKVVQILIPLKI